MLTGIKLGLGGGYPWGCSIDVCFAIRSYECPMSAGLFDVMCGHPNLGSFTSNFWGYDTGWHFVLVSGYITKLQLLISLAS